MPLEVMRRLAGGPRERHITAEELVVEHRQGLVLVMPFALVCELDVDVVRSEKRRVLRW